ncbi:MAG: polymer-forming cytoskeletal protein [Myxococcota bacterium]
MADDSAVPVGVPGKPGLIGKGIRITGRLRGSEDLVIQGRIEGSIALEDNHLVLERSAVVNANADIKNITVRGEMHGNSVAGDKVELCEQARVIGDIKSPRLVMRDGAKFRGSVEMDVPIPDGLEPLPKPAPKDVPEDVLDSDGVEQDGVPSGTVDDEW